MNTRIIKSLIGPIGLYVKYVGVADSPDFVLTPKFIYFIKHDS